MSSHSRKYNTDALFYFPLVTAGDADFDTSPTIAAGDAKVFTDALIFTNVSCEAVAFTSMSFLSSNGQTLTGATSGATCTFMFAVITSGTIGGGDAAGVLFVKNVSGTFQAENLDGAAGDIMTIVADFTAGLFGEVGNGNFVVALTAAEMSCKRGVIHIIDSATKEWEDQAIHFSTHGHANAEIAVDFSDAVRFGLSALPNATADAAGGLPISIVGGLDMDAMNTAALRLTAVRAAVLTDWIDGQRLDLILDIIAVDTTTDIPTLIAALPTQTEITGGAYALDTDALGRMRMVDGTGAGELDTLSGTVLLRSATETQIDDIQTKIGTINNLGSGATLGNNLSDMAGADFTAGADDLESLQALLLNIPTNAELNARTPALTKGTADSGTTTTMVDAARSETDTDYWRGQWIRSTSGTNSGQVRLITGFTPGTDTITFAPAMTQAFGTNTYEILPAAFGDVLTDWINGGRLDLLLDAITASGPTKAQMDTAHGLLATEAKQDVIDTNVDQIEAAVITNATGVDIAADIIAMKAETVLIVADTNELQGDDVPALIAALPTQSEITGGAYSLDTDANGRIRIVDGTNPGELDTASGAIVQVNQLGTQAKADVNAELIDVLQTDTHAQVGQSTPPATATYAQMWNYTYKFLRNKKTQSATELDVYNDDSSTVDHKSTVSDSGSVFTSGEFVTGP